MATYLERDVAAYNRFQDLDGIEAKLVDHLVNSQTKYANIIRKLLKYSSLDALSKPNLTTAERWSLVCNDNGEPTSKRVFFSPFVDDAWQEQCSSIYIYVEQVLPIDHLRSTVCVTIETVTHSKVAAVSGDGDPDQNYTTISKSDGKTEIVSLANPNDATKEGNIVVAFKNRATVLLKCLLAEFNGLYIDGVGYLQFNMRMPIKCKATMPIYNRRSFYGHSIMFAANMAADSSGSDMEVPGAQL